MSIQMKKPVAWCLSATLAFGMCGVAPLGAADDGQAWATEPGAVASAEAGVEGDGIALAAEATTQIKAGDTITKGGTYEITNTQGEVNVSTTEPVVLTGSVSWTGASTMTIRYTVPGANLTIRDLSMKCNVKDAFNGYLSFTGAGNTLTLEGVNHLGSCNTSSSTCESNIIVPEGSDLTIQGSGSLYMEMHAYSLESTSSCIGATMNKRSGDVVVKGGTLGLAAISVGGCVGGTAGSGSFTISGGNVSLYAQSGNTGCASTDVRVTGGSLAFSVLDGHLINQGESVVVEGGLLQSGGLSDIVGPSNAAVVPCSLNLVQLDPNKTSWSVGVDGKTYYSGSLRYLGRADGADVISWEQSAWSMKTASALDVYLTKENHYIKVNDKVFRATWNASSQAFTLSAADPSEYPSVTPDPDPDPDPDPTPGPDPDPSPVDPDPDPDPAPGPDPDPSPVDPTPVDPSKPDPSNPSTPTNPDIPATPDEPTGPSQVTNYDGSVTTTEVAEDGTVTATTVGAPDGSTTWVVTSPSGSSTTTKTTADGTVGVLNRNAYGTVTSARAQVSDVAARSGEVVRLPLEGVRCGAEVTITGPDKSSFAVAIPSDGITSGMVAVQVLPNGSERVVAKAALSGTSVVVPVSQATKVRLADYAIAFPDVASDAWYVDVADFVSARGILTGVQTEQGEQFQGDAPTTRAMFATMLCRMEGEPEAAAASQFADVADDTWYAGTAAWAAEAGLVKGYDDGSFGGDDNVTREQMAVIMMRYANMLGLDTSARAGVSSFADAGEISGYAREAVSWAVAEGLLQGYGDGSVLGAQNGATRAEASAIIMRFVTRLLY